MLQYGIDEVAKRYAKEVAKQALKNASEQLDDEKLAYIDYHDHSRGVESVRNDDIDFILNENNIPEI